MHLEERRVLLHFKTRFLTKWGHNLVVSGAGVLFGNYDPKRAHWATCHHAGKDLVWEVVVPIPLVPEVTYRYAVVDESLEVVAWGNECHTVALPLGLEDGAIVDICDEWMDGPAHLLSRSAFTEVILADRPSAGPASAPPMQPSTNEAIVRLQVWDWEVQAGQGMCVTGGAPQLGNWQLPHVLAMAETRPACWEAEVSVPLKDFPVTYKFAVREPCGAVALEHGESRIAALPASETTRAPSLLVRHEGYFKRERRWRGGGVAVPVFALRSARSVGCGEFADLVPLARWCAAAGLRFLQLLPVADTSVRGTWRDSYPYSSLCVFALHPMYLRLSALADPLPEGMAEEIEAARAALDLPDVDYVGTMAAKLRIARKVFDAVGTETLESEGFRHFYAANEDWLRPYAVFCFLRDLFGTAQHWEWGALARPTAAALARLTDPSAEWAPTLRFHHYLQFHLHTQLKAASTAAAAARVALKGDLPIGVDKASVDTWLHPRLFRMTASTGAPPDYFDPGGQNWGFPTYCWEEMERDGYRWWRRRLAHMAQYFHAYRIDHILGFFRIWELPADATTGLLGRFRPSAPLWRHELEARGIWDFDRLCEPYVTQALLEREFGEEGLAAEVAARYFVEGPGRRYKFRAQYSSEKALSALRPRPGLPQELADEVDRTRKGLMALRQNVVLLRDAEDPEKFYPRFSLASTSSFRELDLPWREELARLHDDYFHGSRSHALWRDQALRALPALQAASDMLVCGEDLGMIPECVPPILEELNIVGLRIQRMPSEGEFGDPGTYPYTTVASPSSHDTSTTRAWYEADAARRERFFFRALGGDGAAAPETCTPDVAAAVVEQHLHSPAMLAIFPLQDLMALSPALAARPAAEETINDPTNAEHYWRYRMHVTIEELEADSALLCQLRAMMVASGRAAPLEVNGN